MTDRAVAEADLMTLFPALEARFSLSPVNCWCRALRRTRPLLCSRRLGEGTLVPSSEVPRTLKGAWRDRKSGSPSSGEA
ncbi:hypothetical protein EYF80_006123 [Liparis tanakae]|uniref:Uncharacterized protein n=1 Tax=Liparis tanakae TaxID=230148 RepID=A0A4Z2IZV3_9TELE|nr:hypothetical protein EYF80_006123 [Liparis tanakae]